MPYAQLALAVALNVASYLLYKTIATRPHGVAWAATFAFALALGAANVWFFTAALRTLRFAVAYPLFSGASIALVIVASAWLFGEALTAVNVAGAAVIVLGIWLLVS